MSSLAQQLAGVHVADPALPLPPVPAWMQVECREGSFARILQNFARSQPECPDAALAVVESVTPEAVLGYIPCRVADHESTHPVLVELGFRLDAMTGSVLRAAAGGI